MGSQHLAIKQLHLISMGRRFKSPSFQTLIKSNSAVVIAAERRFAQVRRARGVRVDGNMAGSELEAPVAGETAMTEPVADLVLSPKSQLVRLLGDILAPQQRSE